MYLIESNLFNVTIRQYYFKLKTNSEALFSLLIVQLLGLFLSSGGNGSSGMSASSGISINVSYCTGDLVVILTILYVFYYSIILTNTTNTNIDFNFVSNRLSSNFSNIGFLITLALYASFTAALSSNLFKLFFYLTTNSIIFASNGFFLPLQYTIINIFSVFLYIILIISIGYFLGSLVHLSQAFLIPIFAFPISILLGFRLLSPATNPALADTVQNLFSFYSNESSLIMFSIKVFIVATIFFLGSVFVSNKLEVRK